MILVTKICVCVCVCVCVLLFFIKAVSYEEIFPKTFGVGGVKKNH